MDFLFRPSVQQLTAYVPGEQPQEEGWTKLNTNENPYPPSPRVVEAIQKAATSSLQKYPDPLVTSFRRVASELFRVDPDWILPGNGSDENLTMIIRSFVDPGQTIAFPYPSYILYGTLAEIQGAAFAHLPLNDDWSFAHSARDVARDSKVVFVPNPNSPSGHCWTNEELLRLVPPDGVFVLDEAYGDFRDRPQCGELLQGEAGRQIIITRTLSKSYSLAGLRFGFAVAHPELIAGMRKVKDSYNCDAIAIAAATAALEDQEWMLKNTAAIQKTRARLTEALTELGFQVQPSEANFVWTTHPDRAHSEIYEQLKARKVLVRFMKFPNAGPHEDRYVDGLRITVGTSDQIDTLLARLREFL